MRGDAKALGKRFSWLANEGKPLNELTLNQLLEFATLKHFGHDVRAADKLTMDIELGDGWPVGLLPDTLANAFIIKNIDGMQIVCSTSPQDVNRIA